MGDEVSNAELDRRLASFQRDVRQDFAEIFRRMDTYVLREVYQAEKGRLEDRIAALERQAKEGEDTRRSDRKWLISAVLIPVAVVLVQIILALRVPG